MSTYISPFASQFTIKRYIFDYNNSVQYTSKTETVLSYFNTLSSKLFINNTYETFIDNSGYDDGARSTVINKRGWNCTLSYSGEGHIGIDPIPALAKRHSNAGIGRSYYTNGEPDYLFIFKRDADQYFNSMTVRYNETYMLILYNARKLDSQYSYQVCFCILRDQYKLLDVAYKTGEVWGTNPVWFGYKDYNRVSNSWSYNVITIPTTDLYATSYTSETIESKSSIIYKNDILKNTYYNKKPAVNKEISFNYTPILPYLAMESNYSKLVNQNLNTRFEFFIEGLNNDEIVDICIKNSNYNSTINTKHHNAYNYIINNTDAVYKITMPKYTHYILNIDKNSNMVRGRIDGNISTLSCALDRETLKIICYKNDVKIGGEYRIDNNWSYSIPNLDANSKYDIILIDESKKIEWRVQSSRSPAPYIKENIIIPPTIKNEKIISGILEPGILKWEYELNKDTNIDNVKIYFSNNTFTIADIKSNPYTIFSENVSGNSVVLTTRLIYKFYMIEVKYKNKSNYSKLLTYNIDDAPIVLKATYNE